MSTLDDFASKGIHANSGTRRKRKAYRWCRKCGVKQASWGFPGQVIEYCGSCVKTLPEKGYVFARYGKCLQCSKKPRRFGLPGEKPKFCASCKNARVDASDYINVSSKKCIRCDRRQPSFAAVGNSARFCGTCKKREPNYQQLINVLTKKCTLCQKIQPSFALQGDAPKFCSLCAKKQHNKDELVDMRSKRCVDCGIKRAIHGLIGGPKLYCGECRFNQPNVKDIVDLTHRGARKRTVNKKRRRGGASKCIRCKNISATYNVPGSGPLFCATCRDKEPNSSNMINIRGMKCKSCHTKCPSFGYAGGKPMFCSLCASHRPDTKNLENLGSKKCEICEQIGASFGPENGIAITCFRCRKSHPEGDDFINLRAKRCGCGNVAAYGTMKQRSLFCVSCAKNQPDFDNLILKGHRKCKSCGLMTPVDKRRLCTYCRNAGRLTRVELRTKAYLENNGLCGIHNKPSSANTTCGSYRPDFLYRSPHQNVVVEVDENQHMSINGGISCEFKRMSDIFAGLGCVPITFIRWNPDPYVEEGERRDDPESNRLQKLVEQVRDLPEMPSHNQITVVFMYYSSSRVRKIEKEYEREKYHKMFVIKS